ncbi:hypothetical protein Tco_1423470 [Tanacetum coccineum]
MSVTLNHFTSLLCCLNSSRKEKENRRSLERETREIKMVELLANGKMFTNEPTPFSLMENGSKDLSRVGSNKRYVVPTSRVVVPTGRYVVLAGKVIIIVSPGRLSIVPTGRVLSPGRVK